MPDKDPSGVALLHDLPHQFRGTVSRKEVRLDLMVGQHRVQPLQTVADHRLPMRLVSRAATEDMDHPQSRWRTFRLESRPDKRATAAMPNQQTPPGKNIHRPIRHDRADAQHGAGRRRRKIVVTRLQSTTVHVVAKRLRKSVDPRNELSI